MNAIIIYISEKHNPENTENELIRMLTDLFDERINGPDKVQKFKSEYGLSMTKEVESEVTGMCTYATAMENKGIKKGIEKGISKGMKKTLIGQICRKLRKGKTLAQIVDELDEDESKIKPIFDSAAAFAPDYDEELVIEAILG